MQIVSSSTPKHIIEILKDSQYDEMMQEQSIEILDKLANFDISHEELIKNGLLDFLNDEFDSFLKKDASSLKQGDLTKLARLFKICASLAVNNEIAKDIQSSELIEKMIGIYKNNEDVSFLRDILIQSLSDITSSLDGVKTVERTNLDLKNLVHNALTSQNPNIVDEVEGIIKNLASDEKINKAIALTKENEDDKRVIAYLSFLSSNPLYRTQFENDELLDILMNTFNETDSDELKLGVIKIFKEICKIDSKYAGLFVSKGGLEKIKDSINNQTNTLYLIELIEFLIEAIKSAGESFSSILEENKLVSSLINHFIAFSPKYEEFTKKAMTPEKAFDSIEYYKSDVTRAILLTTKNISAKDVVPMDLALDYISYETLSARLLQFLTILRAIDKDFKFDINKEFFYTCSLLMKVFKNSKEVHENIFDFLKKFNYTLEQGIIVLKLHWPFQINNVILLKPKWKIFSYYVLHFLEALMKNSDIVKEMQQGVASIKLVAAIQHFINDEDFKDFGEEEQDETADVLTYSQEREIYKKSAELLNRLIDSGILLTFKNNITKSIDKFKPKPEGIAILRAEYSVLALANSINYFGFEGLQANMHSWLEGNIEKLEKTCKYKDFTDKEKLIADCIRSIANYVCITGNEKGKIIYEKNEVSVIVFKLFEQYLKNSKRPFNSYVLLKAFREWLVNRIETIENVSNLMREKIYDKTSFMMIPKAKTDETITNVMDSLYLTHTNFQNNEKVVLLNFEVIMLLGYVYPEWKAKVAKNFIPQILNALGSDNLSKEVDLKAIELLKQMIGTNEGDEAGNKDLIDFVNQNDAIEKIMKSISDNKFDAKYIAECKGVLEQLGSDEKTLEPSYEKIDELINDINAYNKKGGDIKRIEKALNQLNTYCMVDSLKKYMKDKGHPNAINDLWSNIRTMNKGDDKLMEQVVNNVEKSCAIGINQHLGEDMGDEDKKKIFGNIDTKKNNIIVNALKSLQDNKRDPELVELNARIVNSYFPSNNEDKVIKKAKEFNFNDDLDFLLKNYGESPNGNLSNEVNNLYLNLSEDQNDNRIKKNIKTVMKAFHNDLKGANSLHITETINKLIPYSNHDAFIDNFDELNILKYIEETLELLHNNLKKALGKDSKEVLADCLGSQSIPDLTPHHKKLLEGDIILSSRLFKLIINLPNDVKEKVKKHAKIVGLSDIIVLLNRSTDSFFLYDAFLTNPSNKKILLDNNALEYSTMILMKANKDSFKAVELTDEVDITKSMLTNMLRQSVLSKSLFMGPKGTQQFDMINPDDFKTATRTTQTQDLLKESPLTQNLKLYRKLMAKLLTPENKQDIIEKYIKALNQYKNGNEESLFNALSQSRMMLALIKSDKEIDLSPFADKLKKAFLKYLDNCKGKSNPNRKLMKFFENIFCKTAKKLEKTSKPLNDFELWNDLVDIYLVNNPGLVKNNPRKILKSLKYTTPKDKNLKNNRTVLFREEDGYIVSEGVLEDKGFFNDSNYANIDKILANFKRSIDKNEISIDLYAPNMEALSKSKQLCKTLLNTESFGDICSNIVFYQEFDNSDRFIELSEIFLNIIDSIKDDKEAVKLFNKQIHADNILFNYIDNVEMEREDLLPISFEVMRHLFDVLDNRSPFFDKNLPSKLMEFLGPLDEWKDKLEALTLTAVIVQDPSLENRLKELGADKVIFETLRKEIINKQSKLINPDRFPFNKLSKLSDNNRERFLELQAYLAGELSKYEAHAIKFVNPENKLPNFVDLYDTFERLDNNPVFATKIIETTRNVILQLDEEKMKERSDDIERLLKAIPDKIHKFKHFKLIPKYLQDILDFLQNFDKQKQVNSMLNKLANSLIRKAEDEASKREKLKDAGGLATIFQEIADTLKDRQLNNDEAKTLEMAETEVDNMLNGDDTNAQYTLNNLGVPKYLRLIANSDNSNYFQKTSALQLLNKFANNEDIKQKMTEDFIFVSKSGELINQLVSPLDSFEKANKNIIDCLGEDLKFLETMTDNEQGTKHAFKAMSQGLPLIDSLFKIIESDLDDNQIKASALKVLTNLMNFTNDKELEKKILKELPKLFKTNNGIYDLQVPLISLMGVVASKSNAAKMTITKNDFIQNVKKALSQFPDGKKLNTAAARTIYELCNEFSGSHDNILTSQTLPFIANNFKKIDSEMDMHKDTVKSLLQLSFKNDDRKLELINQGFIKGLVPLLIHYSSKDNFDPDMCTLVLKCMANFSSIPQGVEILLKDDVIPAFRNFFNTYKQILPEQNKFMMCTVSNIAYEPKDHNINKILGDKGIELILETLRFYSGKRDLETTEICIDALANVSAHPKALEYLNKTNVIDILVDILRQQLNDRLCYKTLRCLTNFCKSDKLSKRFMDKGGHVVTIDIVKPFRDDNKNVFQSLKLLNILADKYDNKLEEFAFAGVPIKIIQAFKENWP